MSDDRRCDLRELVVAPILLIGGPLDIISVLERPQMDISPSHDMSIATNVFHLEEQESY